MRKTEMKEVAKAFNRPRRTGRARKLRVSILAERVVGHVTPNNPARTTEAVQHVAPNLEARGDKQGAEPKDGVLVAEQSKKGENKFFFFKKIKDVRDSAGGEALLPEPARRRRTRSAKAVSLQTAEPTRIPA